MHPAMVARWKAAHERRHGCAHAGCGEGFEMAGRHHHGPHHGGGGPFGVRRPLRFLAYRLDLDESQVEQLAAILDDIKTERAQLAVDDRRALKLFAEAMAAETFDTEKAEEAAKLRGEANARLERTIVDALSRVHALLDAEQRATFAYLVRSGHLSV